VGTQNQPFRDLSDTADQIAVATVWRNAKQTPKLEMGAIELRSPRRMHGQTPDEDVKTHTVPLFQGQFQQWRAPVIPLILQRQSAWHLKRILQTPRQRTRQRGHLRCETQPGASAQPLSKPHGGSLRAKGHCKRPANALASARTFGVKHSRGLPPNRYQSRMAAACGQKDTANAPPTHSPARAPSVRNTAGGFRPTAIKAAWRQPAGKRTLQTLRQCTRQRVHLRCETQPGAPAQPLSKPHGGSLRAKGHCKHSANALASARTFGVKHSRGLPPNRYQSRMAAAQWQSL